MQSEAKVRFMIEGLDCADCAAKIERGLRNQEEFRDVTVNFSSRSLVLDPRHLAKAQVIIDGIHPGVKLVPFSDLGSRQADTSARPTGPELARLALGAVLFVAGILLNRGTITLGGRVIGSSILLAAYAVVGTRVLVAALRRLWRREWFDESFLMSIATVAAIGIGQLSEAVAVMLFYGIGEYLQGVAVARSRRSIEALVDLRPDVANLVMDSGLEQVHPSSVSVGSTVAVRPGEKVPLDGQVVEGTSFVDTSALTGEPTPRRVAPGDQVLAGTINGAGMLTVRVDREFGQSSVSRILDLVQDAGSRKAQSERFITRFARYYTPVVVAAAAGVAFIPYILGAAGSLDLWIYRALTLLVISCPCALVISVPLSYFGGIGGASRSGVLIKGANYLESLAELDTVVFDKTGTLTEGDFRVASVAPSQGHTDTEVIEYAALAEVLSSHPIGRSIVAEYERMTHGGSVDATRITSYVEEAGKGVEVRAGGHEILVGSRTLLEGHSITLDHELTAQEQAGTVVYVAVDGMYRGKILIADEVRSDAALAVSDLKSLGVRHTVMLTGDRPEAAAWVGQETGIDTFRAELLPEGKVDEMGKVKASSRGKVAFVGDGINDAPVIASADVGVAMGGLGSDAAIEAADVVIMGDSPSKLGVAMRVARRTRAIVKQNIIFSIGVKLAFILLGVAGMATIWEAVFADVGVTLLAVVNSARTLKKV